MTSSRLADGGGRIAAPAHLKALKLAHDAAKNAFHDHQFDGDRSDLDAQIAFDLEEKRLLQAATRAGFAYEGALAAFIAAETEQAA